MVLTGRQGSFMGRHVNRLAKKGFPARTTIIALQHFRRELQGHEIRRTRQINDQLMAMVVAEIPGEVVEQGPLAVAQGILSVAHCQPCQQQQRSRIGLVTTAEQQALERRKTR